MRDWKIVLGILLISIIVGCLFKRDIEPLQNPKGELYLLLEAQGFNVPELNLSQKIMNPSVAQAKFDKVVVEVLGDKVKDKIKAKYHKDYTLTVAVIGSVYSQEIHSGIPFYH